MAIEPVTGTESVPNRLKIVPESKPFVTGFELRNLKTAGKKVVRTMKPPKKKSLEPNQSIASWFTRTNGFKEPVHPTQWFLGTETGTMQFTRPNSTLKPVKKLAVTNR